MPRPTKAQKEARSAGGGNPNPKTKSDGGKKKGFQTKPARASKDAYLGKARKIKADLIERAKMKKQFAKVLKEEGMTSTRLARGIPVPVPENNIDDDHDAEVISSSNDIENGGEPSRSSNVSSNKPWSRKGKGRRVTGEDREPLAPTAAGRTRALSPSAIGHPEPLANESLRTMKKEAFSKYHQDRRPSGGLGGGGRGKGQPNMGARMGVLLEKIRRDRTS